MKILIATAVLVLAGCATAEVNPLPPLSVGKVHEVPGKSKANVCRVARDWAAVTFKDSKAVVEVYDVEAGTMIGKGRLVVAGFAATPFSVDFTMKVDCRDGKMRSTFDNFMLSSQGQSYPLREDSLNHLQTKAEAQINELDASLFARVVRQGANDF